MTKKIKDLTIGEAVNICLHNKCENCPLYIENNDLVHCPLSTHAYITKEEYLDKEVEI